MQAYKAVGNLGADPVLQLTKVNQKPVVNFRLAINERNGRTVWISCVSFGNLAQMINDRFQKGTKVIVSGRFQNNTWISMHTDTEHTKLELLVTKAKLFDDYEEKNPHPDSDEE